MPQEVAQIFADGFGGIGQKNDQDPNFDIELNKKIHRGIFTQKLVFELFASNLQWHSEKNSVVKTPLLENENLKLSSERQKA